MSFSEEVQQARTWVARCLGSSVAQCLVEEIKHGPEREVWDCRFTLDGVSTKAILSVFKPGDLQSVNSSLQPKAAVQKCVLAMSELPQLGIPTASLLGYASAAEEAAYLTLKVESTGWHSDVRIEAAAVLARLHCLEESKLSPALQHLAKVSDPREYRTTAGEAPIPERKTLVHGDYFSANILPVADGLKILDWETFGWGDPMWDLGFLIGADRNVPTLEIEATIREYQKYAPVNRQRLQWHQEKWLKFWALRSH
ncbi:phosphotransferase [Candidatus Leptofilum sp.]|uniref:phosphotransferase n=1 Tax=Candidatus Leptofilum sp. TaxID=3241576 RepID=UPI003B5C9801